MNRRAFLQTLMGSTVTILTYKNFAWAKEAEFTFDATKDITLWAPYQAFLPDEQNPVIQNPSDGTETGTLTAAEINKGDALTLKYWHGHGGVDHMFTITADQLKQLKSGSTVAINIPTTVVEDHYHFAIIDPNRT